MICPKLVVHDVRAPDVWLECFPVADPDAILSIACRSDDDGGSMGIALRMDRESARDLANYINRSLA